MPNSDNKQDNDKKNDEQKKSWPWGVIATAAFSALAAIATAYFGYLQVKVTKDTELAKIQAAQATTIVTTSSPTSTPMPIIELIPATSLPPNVLETEKMPASTPFDKSIRTEIIGKSVLGTPIEVTKFGDGRKHIILIGGIHSGSAHVTVDLAEQMIKYFELNLTKIPQNATVHIVANLSPDSPEKRGKKEGRLNANGVDLNRNWDCNWKKIAMWQDEYVSGGSAPFSEPETRAIRDYILSNRPVAVIFWEAKVENGLVSPGNCYLDNPPSVILAETYGNVSGYKVAPFTQYSVNGDATDWLSTQNIPAISVILPSHDHFDWANNLNGVQAVLDEYGY